MRGASREPDAVASSAAPVGRGAGRFSLRAGGAAAQAVTVESDVDGALRTRAIEAPPESAAGPDLDLLFEELADRLEQAAADAGILEG